MIGLVGCGRWGSNILRDLVDLGQQVGVIARSDDSVERARAGGAGVVWSSLAEMAEVAGIVVATPTSTHAEVVGAALDRGVPVFCEKPLSTEPASARRLADRAADRLFVMDKWRYHKGIEKLRDIVTSREHGPMRLLRVTMNGARRSYADSDALWAIAPHVCSIVLEVTGTAPTPRVATGWRSSNGWDIDATVHFDGPVVADVATSRPGYERSVAAAFDDVVVRLGDGYDDHLTIADGDSVESVAFPDSMPLRDELAAFVGHLDGGPPPRSSAADGVHTVEAIVEMRRLLGWVP